MKAIFFPIVASMMLTSCLGDIKVPEQNIPDSKTIAEEIKKEIKDQLSDISITDTLYCDVVENDTVIANNDTIVMAGNTKKVPKVATYNVQLPDVKVEIYPNEELAEMQLRQHKTLIGILGIILPCVTLAVIAIIIGVFLYKRMRSRHEVIERAIENNYQLPDSFYTSHAPEQTVTTPEFTGTIPPLPTDLRKRDSGITLCSVGIAMILIFAVWGSKEIAVLGIIPLLIGLGKLLTYYKVIK